MFILNRSWRVRYLFGFGQLYTIYYLVRYFINNNRTFYDSWFSPNHNTYCRHWGPYNYCTASNLYLGIRFAIHCFHSMNFLDIWNRRRLRGNRSETWLHSSEDRCLKRLNAYWEYSHIMVSSEDRCLKVLNAYWEYFLLFSSNSLILFKKLSRHRFKCFKCAII